MTEPCDRCVYVEEAEETEEIVWTIKAERDDLRGQVVQLEALVHTVDELLFEHGPTPAEPRVVRAAELVRAWIDGEKP